MIKGEDMQFIEWCNANNGFLTALLSILTLFVSVIAVVVSIHTARLPYRRKLVTSVATCIMPTDDPLAPKLRGFSVSVTNVGNRNINILHFGLAIKDGVQFVPFICNGCTLGEKSIVAPAEVVKVEYSVEAVKSFLSDLPLEKVVYSYAVDAEWREYKKKYGTVEKILKDIERYKINEINHDNSQNDSEKRNTEQ